MPATFPGWASSAGGTCPLCRPGRRRCPTLYTVLVTPGRPRRQRGRGDLAPRAGFRTVEIRDRELLVNGQPGLHPRRQPARPPRPLRAARSRRRPLRRRPGAEERSTSTRSAPRTTRPTRLPGARRHPASTSSTRRTSRRTPTTRHLRRPALPGGVRRPGRAGWCCATATTRASSPGRSATSPATAPTTTRRPAGSAG